MMEENYIQKEKYSDNQLNYFYNNWYFLNKHEEKLKDTKGLSLETILYSKYYWFSRFTDRFHVVYGFDAGVEQQQFMIVEEIDQKLENVDWNFVESLHHGKEQLKLYGILKNL